MSPSEPRLSPHRPDRHEAFPHLALQVRPVSSLLPSAQEESGLLVIESQFLAQLALLRQATPRP